MVFLINRVNGHYEAVCIVKRVLDIAPTDPLTFNRQKPVIAKWEYKMSYSFVGEPLEEDHRNQETHLNNAGFDGWELVSVQEETRFGTCGNVQKQARFYKYWFKRETY